MWSKLASFQTKKKRKLSPLCEFVSLNFYVNWSLKPEHSNTHFYSRVYKYATIWRNTTLGLDPLSNIYYIELQSYNRTCKLGCCLPRKLLQKLPPPSLMDPLIVAFCMDPTLCHSSGRAHVTCHDVNNGSFE